jgi:hypothetical protein
MTVSLIFVGNSVGALLAGTSNVFITDLIGYRFVSLLLYKTTLPSKQTRQPP